MLAVLAPLGEGRAGALGLDAVGRQLDRDRVGLGVGGADRTAGAGVVDGDVLDDAAAEITFQKLLDQSVDKGKMYYI